MRSEERQMHTDVSGICAGNMEWHLCDGTLYIKGNGMLNLALPGFAYWDGEIYIEDEEIYSLPVIHPWKEWRDSITKIVIAEGCTGIGPETFFSHRNLRKVIFPESLTKLGYRGLARCSKLETLSLPGQVTQIPEEFLQGCISLREVHCGGEINTVGKRAFEGCIRLKKEKIPCGCG